MNFHKKIYHALFPYVIRCVSFGGGGQVWNTDGTYTIPLPTPTTIDFKRFMFKFLAQKYIDITEYFCKDYRCERYDEKEKTFYTSYDRD